MNKIFSKIVIGILLLISCNSLISFASAPLEAYGLNTIAGNSTYLRTSKITPNSAVIFQVTDPMGEVTTLSAVTNENGVAQSEFSNYYTERAGNYLVAVKMEADSFFSNATTFIVYSGEVSLNNSTLSPTDQVIRSYDDDALITVQLFDDYDNPIQGHLVKLISSAENDSIELYSNSELTDSNGQISFKVASSDVGTVTYTAYDVTSDVILSSKAKVVYFDNTDYIFSNNVPDDYAYAAIGNSSLAVDGLKFDEIPSSIKTGESINFTLSAIDNEEEIVGSYIGTVRFSVTDGNASYVNIPEDYTFTEQDLGEHTFSLALSFQQDGSYKIEARDTENNAIFGEYIFIVGGGTNNTNSSGITISNPAPGTYSNNIQVISGKAPAGSQLKIFDNEVAISSITADASGVFSYTTTALADGDHKIYVANVNEIGTIISASETIIIKIDTAVPEISQIVLEPANSVNPGAIVTVKLYTQDDLSQAAVIFNDNIYELKKSAEGYYEGSFAAPIEFGDYDLGVVLVDQLGNESKLEKQAKVNVGGDLGADDSTVLADVTNLKVTPEDHRATLNWDAPKTLVFKIKNYRVYYGLSPNQLTEAIDTFTDSTTWYIPNLKNGVEYYFAVIAIDEKGNVSQHFSNIVAGTPNPIVENVPSPDVTLGTAGSDALDEMEKDASESGPEIIWLTVFSLLGGAFYTIMRKTRESIE